MKINIALLGINSKFIHTNLAIRYIKKVIDKLDLYSVSLLESSINNPLQEIIREIIDSDPKIVIISTYIWNREFVLKTVVELKKINSDLKIYLGGPEVSYDSISLMNHQKEIDGIIKGEGENIIFNLLTKEKKEVRGLYYRDENSSDEIIYHGDEPYIKNLDTLPFPYKESELHENNGKIFYYESARGCPFRCSYCMSSIEKNIRKFSLTRVKNDLAIFLKYKVNLVKFVDRTFNLEKYHYMEIWKYLVENYRENMTFHFEISANLFDEETIDFLKTVPNNYFQFEVGVQTVSSDVMKLIQRDNNLERISKNIFAIRENIAIHLDIIAGLPNESFHDFKNSFNYVYGLKPSMVQLGFLKLLKGTEIYTQINNYNYKFLDFPPYEVLSNDHISYNELLKLKDVEKCLDFYYNSGHFNKSINYIITNFYDTPFEFYLDISYFYQINHYFKIAHKKIAIFNFLYEFVIYKKFEIKYDRFVEYLKFDYLKMGKPGKYPDWFISHKNSGFYQKKVNELVEKSNFLNKRQGYKLTEMEEFSINLLTGEIIKTTLFFIYEKNSTKVEICLL